jgi:unsaturated chondroitin disaccharide hydrolase
MEGDIGFSSRSAERQRAFAGLIRFSRTGTILVRDGDSFSAVTRVRYAAGETYHFRLVEDLPAVSYTVFVTPPGGTEVLLGSNLEIPAEQRGSPVLEGWGAVVRSPGGAELTVCGFTLR